MIDEVKGLPPLAIIVAGGNGAGKTTLVNKVILPQFKDIADPPQFINADIWQQKTFGRSGVPEEDLKAQEWANQERERHISAKRSFIAETVFSHPSKIELIKQAKDNGFEVNLYHVHLKDAHLAINRINDRVKDGGHFVPDDKVIGRYERLLPIVAEATRYADRTIVLDNSNHLEGHKFVMLLEHGKIKELAQEIPEWAKTAYSQQIAEYELVKKQEVDRMNLDTTNNQTKNDNTNVLNDRNIDIKANEHFLVDSQWNDTSILIEQNLEKIQSEKAREIYSEFANYANDHYLTLGKVDLSNDTVLGERTTFDLTNEMNNKTVKVEILGNEINLTTNSNELIQANNEQKFSVNELGNIYSFIDSQLKEDKTYDNKLTVEHENKLDDGSSHREALSHAQAEKLNAVDIRLAEFQDAFLERIANNYGKFEAGEYKDISPFLLVDELKKLANENELTTELKLDSNRNITVNYYDSSNNNKLEASTTIQEHNDLEKIKQDFRQTVLGNEPQKDEPKKTGLIEDIGLAKEDKHRTWEQIVPVQLANRYIIMGDENKHLFYAKDNTQVAAFEEKGAKVLTSLREDRETVAAMLDLAKAKNWESVKLTGTEQFRREAWLEASLRGIETTGYKPKESDKVELQARVLVAEKNQLTQVEKVQEKTTSNNQQVTKVDERQSQNFTGVVIGHGHGNYPENPNAKSYFVVLSQGDKQQTLWGMGLKEAIEKNQIQFGDEVKFSKTGEKSIDVPTTVRDEAGKVVGIEPKAFKVMGWDSQVLERNKDQGSDKQDYKVPDRLSDERYSSRIADHRNNLVNSLDSMKLPEQAKKAMVRDFDLSVQNGNFDKKLSEVKPKVIDVNEQQRKPDRNGERDR